MAGSVFDDFAWWDDRDVLTQITPARFAYIRRVAGGLTGCRALDLGCGGGHLAEPLARVGAKVAGVDISAKALGVARAHAGASGLAIAYLQAPAEGLPFRSAAFDVVVAFDVLEHVADLGRAIAEAARVLRPGGKFIYDTMNRTLVSLVTIIWIGENLWPGGPPKGTHTWRKFIKPGELASLLGTHGIANVQTKGFAPRGVNRRGQLLMGMAPYKGFAYVGYGVKRG
ncbi:MAG: bifunctional 2-polyprenyl-6-hydroxyphenol methylase/3-demethylubiquinol 3-O-methyltransferase UbiG [Chloroflexota bacterium]